MWNVNRKATATMLAIVMVAGMIAAAAPAVGSGSRACPAADVWTMITAPAASSAAKVGSQWTVSTSSGNDCTTPSTSASVTVTVAKVGGAQAAQWTNDTGPLTMGTNVANSSVWNTNGLMAGEYTITATISLTVPDWNASNDMHMIYVNLTAPSIEVGMASAPAMAYIEDATMDVAAMIWNNGTAAYDAATDGNTTVHVKKTGGASDLGWKNFTGTLAVGANSTMTVPVNISGLTAGTTTFTAWVGAGTGNFMKMTADVMIMNKAPDMSVATPTVTPASPLAKDTVTITADIMNAASAGSSDFNDTIWLKGAKDGGTTKDLGNLPFFAVAKGETKTASFTWVTVPSEAGAWVIWVIAGSTNMNNTTAFTIGPERMPVLWVTEISFSTPAALDKPGDKQDVTVTLMVANSGNLDVVNATFDVSVDGTIVGQAWANVTKKSGTTNGMATTTATISAPTKEDASTVNVSATPTMYSGGVNASMWKLLDVPGDLDLAKNAAKSVVASPASQEAQRKMDITVTIENTGDADGIDVAWSLILHNSTGTDAGTEISPPGQKANVTMGGTNVTTWTWDIPAGQALGNFLLILHVGDTAANTSVTVTEYKIPDISVSFGKAKVTGTTKGKTANVKVVVSVVNSGKAACSDAKITIWDAKGKEVNGTKDNTFSSVAGGETKNQTVTFPAKVGTNTYQASVKCTFDKKDYTAQTSGVKGVKAIITGSPGFEGIVLIAAVAFAMVMLSYRRRKVE